MKHSDLLTITIDHLRINTCIGALPLEKTIPQDFDVTLDFSFPYDGSDRLDQTINYADVCALISNEMKSGGTLIEHVAARILDSLTEEWPQIARARVKVSKIAPPLSPAPAATSATLHFSK